MYVYVVCGEKKKEEEDVEERENQALPSPAAQNKRTRGRETSSRR